MRIAAALVIATLVSACFARFDETRVTLRDPSAITVTGSGSPLAIADHDIVLFGRPDQVLSRNHGMMHMRYASRGRHQWLEGSIDTSLANVDTVASVRAAPHRGILPLGLVVGSVLIAEPTAELGYEHFEHEPLQVFPATAILALGVAILANELHARLASDEVTIVK